MQSVTCTLTTLFEDPYWVGLYEREQDGRYEVCKIVFGAEPRDYEVYEYLLLHWSGLRFSPCIKTGGTQPARISPKRMQRVIQRQLNNTGIGTKAQQALKLQQESRKQERKSVTKLQREEEQALRFLQRQEKRREKHRGH